MVNISARLFPQTTIIPQSIQRFNIVFRSCCAALSIFAIKIRVMTTGGQQGAVNLRDFDTPPQFLVNTRALFYSPVAVVSPLLPLSSVSA